MKKLIGVIVDDEADARDLLADLLAQYCPGMVEIAASVMDIPSAIEALSEHDPDLLFLDVQLKAASGFDLFSYFENPRFDIIFVTGFQQYALQAFEFAALHYLLKPVDPKSLKKAVGRAMQKQRETIAKSRLTMENLYTGNKKICISDAEGMEIVEVADILHIEANSNYSKFHLLNGKTKTVSKSIKVFENLLEPKGFFRSHHSHLINLEYVRRIRSARKGGSVVMKNGTEIRISETKIAALKRRLRDKEG